MKIKIRSEIERVFGSISTLRIIGVMACNPNKNYTKYALAKNSMLNDRDVSYALKRLIEIGWVIEQNYGGIKMYKLNLNNEKVKLTIKFLRELGYIE